MHKGHLDVRGTPDVAEPWPSHRPEHPFRANANADTGTDAGTIVISNPNKDILFSRTGELADLKPTKVFKDAKIKPKGAKPKLVLGTKQDRFTVRLQGIDAPELHYRPEPEVPWNQLSKAQDAAFRAHNDDYRQPFGEHAVWALNQHLLKTFAPTGTLPLQLECELHSAIDNPADVCDCYGRFVGDILVTTTKKKPLNLNLWLAEQGLVVPAFYNSMSSAEMRRLIQATERARKAHRGLFSETPKYVDTVPAFAPALQYRKAPGNGASPSLSEGKVTLPKIFRRQAHYHGTQLAGVIDMDLRAYLASKAADTCYLCKDHPKPKKGAVVQFAELVSEKKRLKLVPAPEEIVFVEKDATLIPPSVLSDSSY